MIEIDFNELVRFTDGKKRLGDLLESLDGRLSSAVERLKRGGPFLGWIQLPQQEKTALDVAGFVSSLPASIDQAVIMGIGGSSLGPRALYTAAWHPMPWLEGWKPPGGRKLLFLDNCDPDTVGAVLDAVDFRRTLFVVMTKSGSTAETASQMMVAWALAGERLGDEAPGHFVFVTDPSKGDLRALASSLAVQAFPVPPDVGGRFSVLSCVGLLPAALAAIDPLVLLRGARGVMERCLDPDPKRNPAALLAAFAYLLESRFGRNIHVLMPYADRLADAAAWYSQLWAESLGKRKEGTGLGPTPLGARGATDQHSLLQLLRDGPSDKFVMFVDVRRRRRLPIPPIFESCGAFEYLGGRGIEELISFELQGTRRSLSLAGVPTLSIVLDEAGPAGTAALMALLEATAAVAGFLYGIDPFDQPGVEESKRFAQALMGRKGLERIREDFEKDPGGSPQWIVRI
jgi:glucose-6-phosphate isomerase